MEIQPRSESGRLPAHDVENGHIKSVEHAMSLLQAQASWFAEDRAEQKAAVTERYAYRSGSYF